MRAAHRSITAAALSGAVVAALELIAARLLLPATGGGPGVFLPVLFLFAAVFPLGAELARRIHPAPERYLPVAGAALALSVLALLGGDPLRSVPTGPLPLTVSWALIAGIGPMVLALSMTVPLISPRPGGASVATASNLGAIGGLLFGVAGESFVSLTVLRLALLFGAALVAVLVAFTLRGSRPLRPVRRRAIPNGAIIGASAIASAAIGATSTLLTVDIGGLPILWALPIAAYFAAWSVAFAPQRPLIVLRELSTILAPAGGMVMIASVIAPDRWPPIVAIIAFVLALFSVATALLARVARLLPRDPAGAATGWRTAGIGGALGAAATSLIAPLLLPELSEIALVGAAALTFLALLPDDERSSLPSTVVAGALLLGVSATTSEPLISATLPTFGLSALAALFFFSRVPIASLTAVAVAVAVATGAASDVPAEWRSRSLFGPLSVGLERSSGPSGPVVARVIISGRTVHGSEVLEPASERGQATTYYYRRGPAGDLIGATAAISRAAIIGMGSGSMAPYATASRPIEFIEIDPAVIEAARTRFSYLATAGERVTVIEGEGRTTLAGAPAGRYGLIVIDAFNGDAIPTHLLTIEAMSVARAAAAGDGIIAFHTSNRIFDLAPAIATTAAELGLETRLLADNAEPGFPPAIYSPSEWVAIGSAAALSRLPARWLLVEPSGTLMRDDRLDLFALFRR